jgi:hypothetical protein
MTTHGSQPPALAHWWAGMFARLGWRQPIRARLKREVILYYSHFCSPAVLREIARLRDELDRRYDIFAAGYCRSAGTLSGIDCVPALEYPADHLIALPYPGKARQFDPLNFIGNADLVPMKFFLDRPDYDHYWIIEYDVRFSGSWAELFADLSGRSSAR